jgi:hypothetical protein
MNFKHTDEGMTIQFTWKEKFLILVRGSIFFNAKYAYMVSSHLMKFISENLNKHGDVRKHGQIEEHEKIKST